jgi:Transposase
METQIQRGCGLDVHQATVVACLMIVLKNGKVQKQVQTFGTTTRELVGLREWLLSEGCTHVAMESTGVYWKPVYGILEGAFEIVVANAQHVKKVPGRKTDSNNHSSIRCKKLLSFPTRSMPDQCRTRSEYSGCFATYSCTVGQIMSTWRPFSRAKLRAVSAREEARPMPRNFSGTSV